MRLCVLFVVCCFTFGSNVFHQISVATANSVTIVNNVPPASTFLLPWYTEFTVRFLALFSILCLLNHIAVHSFGFWSCLNLNHEFAYVFSTSTLVVFLVFQHIHHCSMLYFIGGLLRDCCLKSSENLTWTFVSWYPSLILTSVVYKEQ